MVKPLTELPEHTRFGFPIREPLPNMLGWCPCGCKEAITSNYTYVEWDNEYWVDTFHIIAYLKANDDLREVG
jgi:hypothetical protein